MRVLLFGIPGVGKSAALKMFLERNPDWKAINYGDVMMELLEKKGITRDELREKLSLKEYLELQNKALDAIIERTKEGKWIIDTHSVVKCRFGFLPGISLDGLKKLNPSLIIVIYALPEEIFYRRMRDKEEGRRMREVGTAEDIEDEQFMEILYACMLSVLAGIPVKPIYSPQGTIEACVEEMEAVIRDLEG